MAGKVGAMKKKTWLRAEVGASRAIACLVLLALWQAIALSGLFFQDVVPSIDRVLFAFWSVLADPLFYRNLGVTFGEMLVSLAVGCSTGLAAGLALGGSPFLSRAYEHFLHYLGSAPKIIFFPLMILWFGVGPGSKVGMGVISCFFPVAISVAAGMRAVNPVWIRVGRSFRASPLQMVTKVYLPAMRTPILNGFRLGVGVAIIGVLLAETKLSNQGLGFMVMQSYSRFDMPRMYALLIIVIAMAVAFNTLAMRLAGSKP